MSIRSRIFAVIGVVVVAALLQTLVVVYFENQRAKVRDSLDQALWRLENRATLGRLLVQLESAQRSFLTTGETKFRNDYLRYWDLYERTITFMRGQYLDEPELGTRFMRVDNFVREWHEIVSLPALAAAEAADATATPGAAPAAPALPVVPVVPVADASNEGRLRAIHDAYSRFEDLDRTRFSEQRMAASSTTLVTTLVLMAVPALAVVMLLALVAILARILLDPLGVLARSARQISGGNFDVDLPPARNDELGVLVRAFRDMTSAVQRREVELTDAVSREREIAHMYAALRTKAEQEHARLLATISTVPAALVILEAREGRIVLQNRAADALIGREPEGRDERQAYWDRFKATSRDGTPCDAAEWGPVRALRGEVTVGQELIIEHAGGKRIPILVSAAPLRDDQGNISGAVGAFQDITNLYEVDRLKTEFVSVVSHELRTPLTAIKGALQLILSEVSWDDPDQRVLMDVALSNTERLIRIINDILDISKIEAGKLELNPRPCEPAELVRLSMQAVEAIAQGVGVTIVADVPADTPKVFADADRTVQAVVNLLSNALKYAPPRSDVSVKVRPAASQQVSFAVTDRGRGIPAEKLDQLFVKFQQLDGADTRKFRGTGLGLAITKALIEMQGGQVYVESEIGKGSTFSVTIPVARG